MTMTLTPRRFAASANSFLQLFRDCIFIGPDSDLRFIATILYQASRTQWLKVRSGGDKILCADFLPLMSGARFRLKFSCVDFMSPFTGLFSSYSAADALYA
jgi:hypothetical protein